MIYWIVNLAQLVFSILNLLFLIFDFFLLFSVLKLKMSSQSGPFIYIIFMTIFGISEKLIDFLMVDAWPISEWIEPNGGYQSELARCLI